VSTSPSAQLRLLIVRHPDADGRRSQLLDALSRRVALVDIVYPILSARERRAILALSFHPHPRRWRMRADFSKRSATRQTAAVQRGFAKHRGDHDLIMQFQTLCAPGFDRADVPYTVYTDNTMALTQRHYPAWARISSTAADWWIDYERSILHGATKAFTYSDYARNSLIDDYGCSPDDVVTTGAGANQLLDSLGEKDYRAPRALFVGFEFKRKGGQVLLDAWPLVRRRIPDAELTIVGPQRTRPSLPKGVRWLGRGSRAQLGELYSSASLFVMPSLFEPWGHVFVEAMGHGLPCIGTDCCAMPEIIEDGVTGRLVPARDPEALADAISELLADPARMATMGRAGYAQVRRERLWDHVADRMLSHVPSLAPA
jgi:glycosyltransferase involved in cell wall biosynthesis